MRGLEPVNAVVVERRNLAILPGRETVEPGFARVHDQRVDPRGFYRGREGIERRLGILVVDAEAAFDRDRHRHARLHGRDAFRDEPRRGHQAGAEAPALDPARRTADVEVDLVVAEIGADPRGFTERFRVGAAELHRDRVLDGIEAEQPRPVAEQHGTGREHLGIEQGATRE